VKRGKEITSSNSLGTHAEIPVISTLPIDR
jgi:hypothetical protein